MTDFYPTAVGQPSRPGCCTFIFHWEDVDLHCRDRAIPGGPECAAHLIERVQAEQQMYRRWFGDAA